jgi:hypothetical protein
MILFLIPACIFLIFGVHKKSDRHAFNNLLGQLRVVKNWSGTHSLSFLPHFLRCVKNYGMSMYNFVCVHEKK